MSILHNLISMVLLFTLAHARPPLENSAGLNGTDYRLPAYVLPSHYIIKLVPNLKLGEFSFKGESSINISVSAANKKTITLHAKGLKFDEEYTTLVGVNKKTVKPVIHSINNVTDFLTVRFASAITPGSYWLNLKYTGLLNEDREGFYRTSYVNENGEGVWMAASQFEPGHARRAFPCFDEPAMKAKFEISIKHFDNYTAISNMPVISKTKDRVDLQKNWTNFDVTPVMSTYLIAFVVSDLKNISSEDGKFSCWSRTNKVHSCHYALDIIQKADKALEDYTGSGHGMSKMDNVAIPSIGTYAMENWGLVTYSEDVLLYEKGITTTTEKQSTAMAIFHEYAHQWFGNLVTPAWWDYTWLSEGLATYVEYLIADKVEPNWRLMDQMVVKICQASAFVKDENQFEHPMNTKVNSPSEIANIFDEISYRKAGCVLRMISHILTDKVFQTGLRQYSKINEYGVATPDDLSKALDSTTENNITMNIPLKEILDTWENQAGYPVIHVNRLLDFPGYVSINQTRFLPTGRRNTTSTELWWIPINYATQSNPNFNDTQPSDWLFAQALPLKLSDNQWFIFNKQQTGYYRVNYDKKNWALVADYLNTPNYTNIHVLNRAQLLDDSYNLIRSGYLDDYRVFLNISRYLAQEDDYIPWYPAFRAFTVLNIALQNTDTHTYFKSYILKLIKKVENRVGYSEMSGDDHVTKLNRVDVVKWACMMGSVKCADATRKSLIEHINGSKKISPDLREVNLCAGIRTADAPIWNKTFDLYLQSKNGEDANLILLALGCSSEPNIIKSYLAMLIDPDFKNRPNLDEACTILRAVTQGSEAGINITLNFITENVVTLNETYGKWLWFDPYLRPMADRINTVPQIKKLNTFFDTKRNDGSSLGPDVQDSKIPLLDTATYNVKWLEKYEPQIRSFLLSQNLVDDRTMTSLSS